MHRCFIPLSSSCAFCTQFFRITLNYFILVIFLLYICKIVQGKNLWMNFFLAFVTNFNRQKITVISFMFLSEKCRRSKCGIKFSILKPFIWLAISWTKPWLPLNYDQGGNYQFILIRGKHKFQCPPPSSLSKLIYKEKFSTHSLRFYFNSEIIDRDIINLKSFRYISL